MERKLLIYLIIFLSTTCLDNVINVRWTDSMKNYTVFTGGVLFPLSGIFFFAIPMFYLKYLGKITQNNTWDIVSHKDLIIVAFFDSLNSIMQSVPTPHLSIVSLTVFNRLSLVGIPIASYFFLKTRYHSSHILGIFLTIFSISITFIPEILHHKEIGNKWLALYIAGIIPAICSFVYKEKRLKNNVEIWWFNTWICLYQLLIGFLLLPLNILTDKSSTFKNFGKQIGYGFVCQFTGKNMQDGDNCQYSWIWFLLFSVLTTIMNTIMLIIIRDGSSVLFVITNTVKTPITAFLGSIKSLAGPGYKKINISHIYAFILLIISSVVYNWENEIKNQVPFEKYQPLDEKNIEINTEK